MNKEELREKVVNGLLFCISEDRDCNSRNRCPYWTSECIKCLDEMMRDAYELLKPEGPRVMTREEFEASCAGAGWIEIWLAPSDGEPDDFVLEKVAWTDVNVAMDDGYGRKDELTGQYGKKYGIRVWTDKPTPEQSEATPWETC